MQALDTSLLSGIIYGRVEPRIYAFTTQTVPNYLKVGDTYRPVTVRLKEWELHFPNLKQQFEAIAKVDGESYFRDLAIHAFFLQHGIERLKPEDLAPGIYYSKEFFKNAHVSDIENAIKDIKEDYTKSSGQYQFYKFEDSRIPEELHYKRIETFDPRPNQDETIKRFEAVIDKEKPTLQHPSSLLMYAVMRFGKSFTSMCCAVKMGAKLVVVVSAKADVRSEWKKTVESHVLFDGYDFLDSDSLKRDPRKVSSLIKSGKKAVVFLTLQDLSGDDIKSRHKDLFSNSIDLLLIDETHFGARAPEYGKVLVASGLSKSEVAGELSKLDESVDDLEEGIKTLKAKVRIHLSGTPYRILMGDEFKEEDIIAFYQFSDIVAEQEAWDKKYLGNEDVKEWDNPYFGFPQMIRFAFNPSKKVQERLAEIQKGGQSFAFSELFRPLSIKRDSNGAHKQFKYPDDVLDLLEVIDGSKEDENLLGFLDYDRIKEGKMCRHIVCVLPYCASCDALEELIKKNKRRFKNLNQYEIINISGVEGNIYPETIDVKRAIENCERQDKKTITLTVGRMLTGSTVAEWDTMLYLKDTSSPQEYDQAIFRLQNQYVRELQGENGDKIKFNMKPQTLLVDFAPNRMFYMQELKSQIYNVNTEKNGNSQLESRIARELSISPIIVINNKKIEQVKAANILDAVRKYSSERSVMDEALDIPPDMSLFSDPTILSIISSLSPINASKGLAIKPTEGEGTDDWDDDTDETNNGNTEGGSTEDNQNNGEAGKQNEEDEQLDKKLATYYTQILYYAFLTEDLVKSLQDVIYSITLSAENKRIARNVGLHKKVLNIIQKKSNPFILSKLDYKIQNINSLMRDESMPPLDRALVALKKFGRFSDSEIVTPASVADSVVGLLPKDACKGPILDLAAKRAEFTIALYQRFGDGVKENLYSVPTSSIAYEFTRKVYSILGIPVTNVFSDFTSYDLIEQAGTKHINTLKKMNFKAIVGNPPYQAKGGSGGNNDAPIYQRFSDLATDLSPDYISLVIKAAWFSSGRENLLGDFRHRMLTSRRIQKLVVYTDSSQLFTSDVEIKGGCCYYLESKKYKGDCDYTIIDGGNKTQMKRNLGAFDVLIREPKISAIVEKVQKYCKQHGETVFVDSLISSDTPFGISSNPKQSKKNPLKVYPSLTKEHDLALYHIESSKRKIEYIPTSAVSKNVQDIDRAKVFITGAGGSGTDKKVMGVPIVAPKHSVCSQSFLYSAFGSLKEAENFNKYIYTKFFRLLLAALKITQTASSRFYRFIPVQNFTSKSDIDWSKSVGDIDKQLFKKYGLSKEDIAFINERISDL